MRRQKSSTSVPCRCDRGARSAAARCRCRLRNSRSTIPTTRTSGLNPPADWFLGDETQAQKGLVPNAGQPLPTSQADLEKMLANVKLPPGFKIKVWAQGVPQARQMAMGDKGTLFVGTFDKGTRQCRRRRRRQEGRQALHHRPAHADRRRLHE